MILNFDFDIYALFQSWKLFTSPLETLAFCFVVILEDPHLIPSLHFLERF
jgi:hypothetical protein